MIIFTSGRLQILDTWFCLDIEASMNLHQRLRGKFHKLLHLTRDVTGQHYHPVLPDAYLPRLARGGGD